MKFYIIHRYAKCRNKITFSWNLRVNDRQASSKKHRPYLVRKRWMFPMKSCWVERVNMAQRIGQADRNVIVIVLRESNRRKMLHLACQLESDLMINQLPVRAVNISHSNTVFHTMRVSTIPRISGSSDEFSDTVKCALTWCASVHPLTSGDCIKDKSVLVPCLYSRLIWKRGLKINR